MAKTAAKIDCCVIDHCRENSSRVAERAKSKVSTEKFSSHCVVVRPFASPCLATRLPSNQQDKSFDGCNPRVTFSDDSLKISTR